MLSLTVTLLTMTVAGRTWTSLFRMAKTRECPLTWSPIRLARAWPTGPSSSPMTISGSADEVVFRALDERLARPQDDPFAHVPPRRRPRVSVHVHTIKVQDNDRDHGPGNGCGFEGGLRSASPMTPSTHLFPLDCL